MAVRLVRPGDRLEVTVTDDGHGGTQLPEAAHGGGFGLVGLTDRPDEAVDALGGESHVGPRGGADGGAGWQVRAVFPAGKQWRPGSRALFNETAHAAWEVKPHAG